MKEKKKNAEAMTLGGMRLPAGQSGSGKSAQSSIGQNGAIILTFVVFPQPVSFFHVLPFRQIFSKT